MQTETPGKYLEPTEDEIRKATERIRADWDETTEERRNCRKPKPVVVRVVRMGECDDP